MFFSISTQLDSRFPNNYQFDNIWINCDPGWQQTNTVFYKGYVDNYCKITVDSGGARVEHNNPRNFPLWSRDGLITNLSPESTYHWMDDVVSLDHWGKITVNKLHLDLIVPSDSLTIGQAQDGIRHVLDTKLKQAPHNLKLFCSGGVDTLLIYSMLATRHPFELIVDEHYAPDKFTQQNQSMLNKFWAYKQIHHWIDPAWLATGSHGDEYFLRGPAIIAMLTAWHDINFGELLINNPDCYHYHYFNKYQELWNDAWNTRHQLQDKYPTVDALHRQILNMLVNDYQHWHLGNTLTWTPFKDIDIARILLQCPINQLLPQFLDARLSKDLIIDYNPHIIDYLSRYKNHNSKENLPKLLEFHAKSQG
jgi:hypothetical protein